MSFLFSALIAAGIVSLISVIVVLSIFWTTKRSERNLIHFLSLSAGGMLGGALFHLLPEAVEEATEPLKVFAFAVIGFSLFFLIERVLHFHHVHTHETSHDHHHTHLGFMNLFGDAIHNFLDGIVIVTSFSIDSALGIAVTLAVIAHEVPQEIGDFGVLLYAGYSKMRALMYNFIIALFALLGVFVGFFMVSTSEAVVQFLVPFAAGSFMYIAATDLLPEIHKEERPRRAFGSFVVFVCSLTVMYALKIYLE